MCDATVYRDNEIELLYTKAAVSAKSLMSTLTFVISNDIADGLQSDLSSITKLTNSTLYRRATELSPQIPEAHYQLALGLVGAGALGEADFHFGRAAELRGDYLAALGSFRRARRLLGEDPRWTVRIDAALRHLQ